MEAKNGLRNDLIPNSQSSSSMHVTACHCVCVCVCASAYLSMRKPAALPSIESWAYSYLGALFLSLSLSLKRDRLQATALSLRQSPALRLTTLVTPIYSNLHMHWDCLLSLPQFLSLLSPPPPRSLSCAIM